MKIFSSIPLVLGMCSVIVNRPLDSDDASGRKGDIVYLTRRGTTIARKFKKPLQPGTPAQLESNAEFGTLSSRWSDTLTQPQRDSWKTFTLKSVNMYGAPKLPTALNKFKFVNAVLLKASKTLVDAAPISSPPPLPVITITTAAATANISVAMPSAGDITKYSPFIDVWYSNGEGPASIDTDQVNAKCIAYKQSQNPSVSKMRHLYFMDENSSTPQVVYLMNTSNAPLVAGNHVKLWFIRYSKDGLSASMVEADVVITA